MKQDDLIKLKKPSKLKQIINRVFPDITKESVVTINPDSFIVQNSHSISFYIRTEDYNLNGTITYKVKE